MPSQRYGILVSWWSRFCLIVLALLAVMSCSGTEFQREATTTTAGLCPSAFSQSEDAASASQSASAFTPQSLATCKVDNTTGNITIGSGNCGEKDPTDNVYKVVADSSLKL